LNKEAKKQNKNKKKYELSAVQKNKKIKKKISK